MARLRHRRNLCRLPVGCGARCAVQSIIERENTRLYDLENDPLETRDLAGDARYADIAARHRAHFREYISQIELYPEPEIGLGAMKRGNLYREYINWYHSVLNEA